MNGRLKAERLVRVVGEGLGPGVAEPREAAAAGMAGRAGRAPLAGRAGGVAAGGGEAEGLPRSLGEAVRGARRGAGLSLGALAERVGCAKSYLSSIENDRRETPPTEAFLARVEGALGVDAGRLVRIAHWQSAPAPVRREMERLERTRRAAARLAELIGAARAAPGQALEGEGGAGGGGGGAGVGGAPALFGIGGLDALYRNGELRRLLGQIAPAAGLGAEAGGGAGAGGGAEGLGGRGPEQGGEGGVVPVALAVEIPLINSVAAGYPTEFTDLGYPARVADQYVRSPDICDPEAFAARVVGDSMEPEYRQGDIVVFSPARAVRSGMDCFVRLERDHESTFKRVYFEGLDEAEGGEGGAARAERSAARGALKPVGGAGDGLDASGQRIRLQPLNSKYPARVFAREAVAGMYAAVSVLRAV